ncbi:MAG TPA: hypothetical protein DCX78_04295, partial [Nitrospina sp.]|nr:hypothetical protein [Nitrospina sp.]
PPVNALSEKYKKVFALYDSKVSKVAQWCAARLRHNFIRKHLNKDEVSQIVSLSHPAIVPSEA